jgi:hypothetical protein
MAFEISDESGSSFEKDFSPERRAPAPAPRRAPASAYDFDIEDDDMPSPPSRRPAVTAAPTRAVPGAASLQAKERAAALAAATARQQQTFKDSAARA